MNSISDFKIAHKRFIDALRYLVENEQKLKTDPAKWQKIKDNFYGKFEKPLDEAWQALTAEEKKRLAPLYLHRKAQSDPIVQKIIETFNGKIISIEIKANAVAENKEV